MAKTRTFATSLRVGDAHVTDVPDLDLALRRELPAFQVMSASVTPDYELLVVITTGDDTPDHAWQRVEGFPVAGMTLREVR